MDGLGNGDCLLLRPERDCVRLDSNGKKISFLKQFVADLKLKNVIAVQTRVEDEDSIRDLGQFDVITSRAFASLIDFVTASKPYMHDKSIIASMKGLIPEDEIIVLKDGKLFDSGTYNELSTRNSLPQS